MMHIRWKCPNCASPLTPMLTQKPYVLRCAHGHSFDVARQGYVNLLLPQKRGAALPGDDAGMVRARTAFLDGGYYSAFSDGVNACVLEALAQSDCANPTVTDAGCGEGYYTARLYTHLQTYASDSACVGFDLSRDAVAHAAKRGRAMGAQGLSFAVASLFDMPIEDGSSDGIINLFAPVADAEFARILKPDGFLLIAVPAEEHLWGMKQILYRTPYPNEVRRDTLAHFTLTHVQRITDTITVTDPEHIRALFAMTPYFWKTAREDAERLYACEQLCTTVSFDLLLYRKSR
ncbi:MAG: methyltransferase domain-containing protein [Clostridia bacterium]|nr:methyltransferase domain-containing protein [Clostridia bacterium]